MKAFVPVLAALAILSGAARSTLAHHSFAAEYDDQKPLKITGTLTKVEWMNPHIWYYVDVKNADGSVTTWAISGGAPGQLMRRGITKDLLVLGSSVNVEGFRAKDGIQQRVRPARHLSGWPQRVHGHRPGRPRAAALSGRRTHYEEHLSPLAAARARRCLPMRAVARGRFGRPAGGKPRRHSTDGRRQAGFHRHLSVAHLSTGRRARAFVGHRVRPAQVQQYDESSSRTTVRIAGSQPTLALLSDTTHLAAGAVWIGGLSVLLARLLPGWRTASWPRRRPGPPASCSARSRCSR